MQKYDEKIENLLKEVLEEIVFNNLDDARGDVRNNAKWVYIGYLIGVNNNLHRTGGTTNPNKMWNCIFCESTRIWGQTTLGWGLLKLEFHSDSTKNTSLDITFVS